MQSSSVRTKRVTARGFERRDERCLARWGDHALLQRYMKTVVLHHSKLDFRCQLWVKDCRKPTPAKSPFIP
jgi:hypothetical protein